MLFFLVAVGCHPMNVFTYFLSFTDDFLQTDMCECMRTCLVLEMLWYMDSALCARYVSAEWLHPGWRTPLCLTPMSRRNCTLSTAHLCILRAWCLGEPAAQLGPVKLQVSCSGSWSASLDHKINTHARTYFSFGGGKRSLAITERESPDKFQAEDGKLV